jgi:hypothetical protein
MNLSITSIHGFVGTNLISEAFTQSEGLTKKKKPIRMLIIQNT